MLKINDSIYVFPFEERRDRPNIGLIIGKDKAMLVDFGISNAHLDEVLSDIEKSNLKKPSLGVLTHYHYDHSFAMSHFDGISVASKRTNSYLSVLKRMPMNEQFLSSYLSGEALSFCLKAIKEEYKGDYSSIKIVTSNIEFENYLKINLGDKEVELFHMFSPHSDDAVYVKCEDVLFIGDSFFYDIFNGETTYNKEKLEALYMILSSFDVTTIVEGHSKIKTKKEILDEIKQLI